jgi:putative ABC transport system substrate-binding protein
MAPYAPYVDDAGRALGIRTSWFSGRNTSEIDAALSRFKAQRPAAIYVVTTGAISATIERIIESVTRLKIPTIYTNPLAVKQGGLMSYTADYAQLTQRCAVIAERVLKGANPRDVPVEQATKYVLVINLKAAKALGLTMPQSLLLRADQVIE